MLRYYTVYLEISKLQAQCENFGSFLSLRFYMKSIAFGEFISFRSPKTGIFLPIERAKFHVILNSELRNVLKWQSLHF